MKIEIDKGISIYQAAQQAVEAARTHHVETHFVFNGLTIFASPFSHPDNLATIYSLMSKVRQLEAGI